jgi:ribA/ribD-fused uncharacterized protein
MINKFDGENRWLSNFHPAKVALDGIVYPSVENAYQAAKTLIPSEREQFIDCTSAQAKQRGKLVTISPCWEKRKYEVMWKLLWQKFQYTQLQMLLLSTGDEKIVEGNYWHDNYWGSCSCQRCGNKGKNILGFFLMEIRKQLRG